MKPILLIIDDDPQVLRAIKADLRAHYKADYTLVEAAGVTEARQVLAELKGQSEQSLALVLSDQRMPDGEGVELLEQVRDEFPEARRILLTAYADTDAAIRAINSAQVHYYLTKPWQPPQDKLYPVLDEQLEDYRALVRMAETGNRLIGHAWSPESHALKDFLTGNLVPYRFLTYHQQPEAAKALAEAGLAEADLPVLLIEGKMPLARPTLEQAAEQLGLSSVECDLPYDVAIIGAGPAGLASAVYGASEGLRTLLIDRRAPGGQAGTSSRIENYLGFPQGVSGEELSRRAITQAKRLGAEFLTPANVDKIETKNEYKILSLHDGRQVTARAVIIATGVDYRRLEAEGVDRFAGAGVYYGAANTEAQACRNQPVFVVGGGNSAGQAAMYLSRFASKVVILVRNKDGLGPTMSQYLIDQIGQTPNIKVRPCCRVVAAQGQDRLESLDIENADSGETEREVPASALFIFIGTRPVTDWIGLDVVKNDKGYIETGRDLASYKDAWKLARQPLPLETCAPGVFAAGDVRAGAMNRVASAVGEGAMAIKLVHEYLAL